MNTFKEYYQENVVPRSWIDLNLNLIWKLLGLLKLH